MIKLKGFTILELMVGMALMAILLQLGFYGFQLLQKQYFQKQKVSEELSEVSFLESALFFDNQRAIHLLETEYGITFKNHQTEVAYLFYPEFIVRQELFELIKRDTFFLQNQFFGTLFQNDIPPNSLIDQVQIDILLFERTYPIHLIKQYSADDLINYQ